MNKSLPVISVITIVKNNEELLPRAVDSVLAQSFTDFEHIIVNDGSTDSTKAIIDDYAEKDNRVKPKHMSQNVGRAMARNKGLDTAKGKYIFFLDADDYLPEAAFMDLYEVAEMDNVDIVFGRFRAFDQLTGQMKAYHYSDDLINKELHKFRLDDHLAIVKNHSIIGRLYRRALLEKNKIRFSTVRKNGEDVVFAFYTAFYAATMSMIPAKIVYYYSIGNFLATANESKLLDAMDNLLETLQFSIKNGSDALIKEMQKKAASFAADLRRAKQVYGLGDEFKSFLPRLLPLIKDIPDDVLQSLPPYPQSFTHALLAADFDGAFSLYTKEYNLADSVQKSIQAQTGQNEANEHNNELHNSIVKLNALNQGLAHRLDTLYDSMSWRITTPFRWGLKMLIKGE